MLVTRSSLSEACQSVERNQLVFLGTCITAGVSRAPAGLQAAIFRSDMQIIHPMARSTNMRPSSHHHGNPHVLTRWSLMYTHPMPC